MWQVREKGTNVCTCENRTHPIHFQLTSILKPSSRHQGEESSYSGSLSQGAVIVYVWRQRDTEVVAEYLNSSDVAGGIVVYHGGMDKSARNKAQSKV